MNYLDEFVKFEIDMNLFEWEVCGIKPWSYIRFNIYMNIISLKENIGQAHTVLKDMSTKQKYKYRFEQLYNVFFNSTFKKLKKCDLLVLNHERRVKNNGYYECLYTDILLESVVEDYYVFEKPYVTGHFSPVRTKNLRYLDSLFFRKSIKTRFLKSLNKYKMKGGDVNKVNEIINKLNNLYDINLSFSKYSNLIQDTIYEYKASEKLFNKLLDKTNPKAILEVVYYSPFKMMLNEIAKQRNIKIIELQHGTIGNDHIAYNFYNKFNLKTFPDYIFTFGQYWVKDARLPISNDKAISVGFPYLERKIKNGAKNIYGNKQVILFISQGTIGEELSELACDLYKKLDNSKYKIIYKLHPGEYATWKNRYPWLINSGIEVIETQEKDIYHYFSVSTYQVGVYSTAVLEGLAFNLRTFIYKTYGYEKMRELYESSVADLITTSDDIYEAINKNSHYNVDYEMFWKTNSICKAIETMENIIRE